MHSGIVNSFSTSSLDRIKVMSVRCRFQGGCDRSSVRTKNHTPSLQVLLQAVAPCTLAEGPLGRKLEVAGGNEADKADATARGAAPGERAHTMRLENREIRRAIRRFRFRGAPFGSNEAPSGGAATRAAVIGILCWSVKLKPL
jgi:hypothetical protein